MSDKKRHLNPLLLLIAILLCLSAGFFYSVELLLMRITKFLPDIPL